MSTIYSLHDPRKAGDEFTLESGRVARLAADYEPGEYEAEIRDSEAHLVRVARIYPEDTVVHVY
jgi:hypothetical protein